MKFLLVAVNAKYIHSNPAVYSLKTYAEDVHGQNGKERGKYPPVWVEIAEYTINHLTEKILEDIYQRKPDVIGFSCYIWNIHVVLELVRDLHKVLPDTDIWLGGPEVSFDGPEILKCEPEILGVMKGEGEDTFAALLDCYQLLKPPAGNRQQNNRTDFWRGLSQLSGITYRRADGEICDTERISAVRLNRIPFFYQDVDRFENRIIYYESSRGCPFSCSYCLSSIDRSIRFRDLKLVMQELDFFLKKKVPQVKFMDRTFNCKREHAMAVWQYILEHDNGVTNFHFEVAADLMGEEELALIGKMRPGLIQLEIGVQSTNPKTIREIQRKMDLERVRKVVAQINDRHNVHQHLDLIVGLPYEDYESFHRSFNDVYAMEPEQLQVGFLKVLKGSHMYSMAQQYELSYREKPPYEVLSTRWLPYRDVIRLKEVENMVEVYYNSGQFAGTLKLLVEKFGDAFMLYERLAGYYKERKLNGQNHSRMARYDILHQFIQKEVKEEEISRLEDALVQDCYLRENCKSRPMFALEQAPYKNIIRRLVPELRNLGTQIHVEVFRSGEIWLFDYRDRDPLTRNAAARRLQ
ncbi:MAG: B12-binding domain-containing radical SAM protein [Lachnospiraceae bacterium]|jgi:radical SAM superfamily enzyme YgiQ (UPF0313 family)|nr:B12-binding domain-containing radical SAM protein [Lachnospiraceae bacterium]